MYCQQHTFSYDYFNALISSLTYYSMTNTCFSKMFPIYVSSFLLNTNVTYYHIFSLIVYRVIDSYLNTNATFLSLYLVLLYRLIDSYLNTNAAFSQFIFGSYISRHWFIFKHHCNFIILYSVLIYRVIDSYLITNATFLSLYSVLIYRVIDSYSSTNVMLLFSFFNTIIQCNTIQYTFI